MSERPFADLSDVTLARAAAVARLTRSLLDPELFPHTAYVKILATLARKTENRGCQQRATHLKKNIFILASTKPSLLLFF